jgi:ZIP family zinc transporter
MPPAPPNDSHFVLASLIAGLVASLACGLGALPLAIRGIAFKNHIGLGYGFAGGLMVAASVYNLLLPAFALGSKDAVRLWPVVETLLGMAAGCGFLWSVQKFLTPQRLASPWLRPLGGRVEALVFLAMSFHSIPEGVAVGVGFAAETYREVLEVRQGLGLYVAAAIAIHNIPEGLAVALPMRAGGASIARCYLFAFLTSLPQPLAAVPAALLVWLFQPLMLPLLGFSAGAMMYLVVVELIPDGLETTSRSGIAWTFMAGFGLMMLVQVAL